MTAKGVVALTSNRESPASVTVLQFQVCYPVQTLQICEVGATIFHFANEDIKAQEGLNE